LVTIRELIRNAGEQLRSGGVENYNFDARCLAESVLDMTHSQLIVHSGDTVDNSHETAVNSLVQKRISGYPLQYLTGQWEFYGLPFYVGEGVLIPRQDTELLVECVVNGSNNYKNPVIADLCSGSGCIAISVNHELKEASVHAAELSEDALRYLSRNISLNDSDVTVHHGDVLDNSFVNSFPTCDIIVSNPPYLTPDDMNSLQKEVSFEPEMALAGGSDGLFFYRRITELWKHRLVKGGMIYYEIGAGQENDVSDILSTNGFCNIEFFYDLNHIIRVVSGKYKG